MFPKIKIESRSINVSGECIKKTPYTYGVQWKEKQSDFNIGSLYDFELNVNGDKGFLTLSDEVTSSLTNKTFQQLLISELQFNTTVIEFGIIIKDVYKLWLEIPS